MKVFINTSPLSSGHRFRGVGYYTQNLLKALQMVDRKNTYLTRAEDFDRADVLHVPFFSPFAKSLPWRKRAKLVVTIHDLIPLLFPDHYPPGAKGKIAYKIQKFLIQKAEAVITDSQASKKDIIRFLNLPAQKIKVIYLAPGDIFSPITNHRSLVTAREKYHLPKRFILYVGDINYNKNIPALVTACEQIDFPLVIVGKQAANLEIDPDHPENQDLVWLQKKLAAGRQPLVTDLRSLATEHKSPVIALGFVPSKDLPVIYSLATVYCQPSLSEGFGLPVLEAMACGCPVVASRTSSLPEVCGSAALLVAPKADKLARALLKVSQNQQLQKLLKNNGLVQAGKFSWIKTAQETCQVYESVYSKN
ncbi:glycosyltransferase family 4 protein [Patescibacteria group bacterium]